MNSAKPITRSQKLLAHRIPESIRTLYDDLQSDYRSLAAEMFHWGARTHAVQDGECFKVVTPESQSDAKKAFADALFAGQEAAYGSFYAKYTPLPFPRKDSALGRLTAELGTIGDEKYAKALKLNGLDPDEWAGYRNRAIAGEPPDALWEEIKVKVGVTNKATLASRGVGNLPTLRPDSKSYATALAYMLSSSLSSWEECAKLHRARREEIAAKAAVPDSMTEEYALVCQLAQALEEAGSGLTAKMLNGAIREMAKTDSVYMVAITELADPKYKPLLALDKEDRARLMDTWQAERKLSTSLAAPKRPLFDKDYQIPFGMTGRGESFALRTDDSGRLWVKIGDHEEFSCAASDYFGNLKVEALPSDKGYKITYRKMVKNRRRQRAGYKSSVGGPLIEGEVKQILLQRRMNRRGKESFYVYLPHSIAVKDDRRHLSWFFKRADWKDGKGLEELPDQLIVSGIDLNIDQPVTVTKAIVSKNYTEGEINCPYGGGHLTGKPRSVCPDTPISQEAKLTHRKMRLLIEVIRESKACHKAGTPLSSEGSERLKILYADISKPPCRNNRESIQVVYSSLKKTYRRLKYELMQQGANDVSGCIRMLQLDDTHRALTACFDAFSGKPALAGRNFGVARKKTSKGTARLNFREHVSHLYANAVLRACHGSDVVFIEDLSTSFDGNAHNSLKRLFAPGQLIDAITSLLESHGIAVVTVDPSGTSRRHPITGDIWYRDSMKKRELVGLIDGELVSVNDDLAASINVLTKGLNHSVVPHKFKVDPSGRVNVKEDGGKRLKVFLREKGLSGRLPVGSADAAKSKKAKALTVYPSSSGLLSDRQVFEVLEQIKHLLAAGCKPRPVELMAGPGETYAAFSLKEVLEWSKSKSSEDLRHTGLGDETG